MNILFGALALVLATPAFAQTVPSADPHAGHAQHQQGGHEQHQQGRHADHGAMHGDHSKAMDCCKDGKHKACCDKMKQQGSAMACCKDKQAEAPAKPAEPSAHEGHDH